MSFLSWLQKFRSALTPGRGQRHPARRGEPRAGTHRPKLEFLEDRLTPSFTWYGSFPLDPNPPVPVQPQPPLFADVTSDGVLDEVTAAWNEVVVLLTFDLKVGETRGSFNLCVPASVIEATGTDFSQGFQQAQRERTPSEQQWLAENLGRVLLPVTTDIQTRVKTRELIELQPGHILSLGVPAEAEVNVTVAINGDAEGIYAVGKFGPAFGDDEARAVDDHWAQLGADSRQCPRKNGPKCHPRKLGSRLRAMSSNR